MDAGVAVVPVDENRKPIRLTEENISLVQHNTTLSEKLVNTLLVDGIDYGRVPGSNKKALFDPGASKIFNAYNCYTDYRILHYVEDKDLISYTIQAVVFNRASQEIVNTGIGACSSREVKYKYRNVSNPSDFGYTQEEISALKKTKENQYRIPNPEFEDLVNTIVKMAAKRADVDAALGLPGVGSAIRKMLDPQDNFPEKEDWRKFWNAARAMGLEEERVHKILQVGSMKEWLAQGRTLNEAIEKLSGELAAESKKASGDRPAKEPTDPEKLKTREEALAACHRDFGMQPADVARELGYKSIKDVTDPPALIYRVIAKTKQLN